MRRLVYALILAAVLCSAALGESSSEIESMSTFLRNFTELRYYNINIDTITDKELVHYGADGEPVLLADVQKVSRNGNTLTLRLP